MYSQGCGGSSPFFGTNSFPINEFVVMMPTSFSANLADGAKRKQGLEERVVRAAEAALSRQQYVSAIDVLCGMGLLLPMHVDSWRKGRVDYLERVVQGNLHKISSSMAIFRRWAREKDLKPSETRYVRRARSGTIALQFSKSGDPAIEKNYSTHYISPALSERKQEKLQEKLNGAPQPVVFEIVRDSRCSECGVEMEQGSFPLDGSRAAALPGVRRFRRSRVSCCGRHRFDAPRNKV